MNIVIIYILLIAQILLDLFVVYWLRHRWPANGFVRLPKKYQNGSLKREADKQAAKAASPDTSRSRVRKARIQR